MLLREYKLMPDDLLDFKVGELVELTRKHQQWVRDAQEASRG